MDWRTLGASVVVSAEGRPNVRGWLWRETPDGIYVALDKEAKEIRFVRSGGLNIGYQYEDMAPWAVPDRQALIQRIYDPPPSAGCARAAGWKARPEARRSARETDDVVPEPRSPRQREREITNGGGVKYDRSKGQQRDTQGIRGRELAGCDDYPAGLLPHPIAAQAAGQVSLGEPVVA